MTRDKNKASIREFMMRSSAATIAAVAIANGGAAFAQESDTSDRDIVIVTGTRIQNPNVTAASPVTTVGQDEILRQFTPNLERVFRDLPITIPGDGENVNNGTTGAAEIDLRGLGPERSLIMIDGKRLVPYNDGGIVDINTIPLNLVDRIDIITGGASAVYGSDAMSGAVNFITRKEFEGVELGATYTLSEEGDGDTYDISALLGANFADGRGNVMMSLNYTDRSPVQLGARPYGIVGVDTETGAGADGNIVPAPAECDAPGAVAIGGSGTAIPGAIDLPGGLLQFRNDGTIGPRCSVFNFNPFNYYQTPQERFGITAIGSYQINDSMELYARGTFASVNVRQQIAPSGVFFDNMEIPLLNPFIGAQAQTTILNQINALLDPALGGTGSGTGTFLTTGVNDLNGNNVFDLGDSITAPVGRRTLELGTRSTSNDTNLFQIVAGMRGGLNFFSPDWNYDLSFQYGESDRTVLNSGYTNLLNIATAINTVSSIQCETPSGVVTGGCVPINVFGGFGSITPEAAAYASAVAFQTERATQVVVHGSISGPVENLASPWAETPFNLALGFEHREETARLDPDECLKTIPDGCLGGSGGNTQPINAGFGTWEGFIEGILPVVEGQPLFESLSLEGGYRYSDYNPTEATSAWKAGVSWQVTPSFRLRYMEQKAVRAPNVGEIGSPAVTGLDNANYDPCSVGNPNPVTPQLVTLCEATGVPAGLTGLVGDIISGQVDTFEGTNPMALPTPETARTRTIGMVWRPDLGVDGMSSTTLSVDYYDIKITD